MVVSVDAQRHVEVVCKSDVEVVTTLRHKTEVEAVLDHPSPQDVATYGDARSMEVGVDGVGSVDAPKNVEVADRPELDVAPILHRETEVEAVLVLPLNPDLAIHKHV